MLSLHPSPLLEFLSCVLVYADDASCIFTSSSILPLFLMLLQLPEVEKAAWGWHCVKGKGCFNANLSLHTQHKNPVWELGRGREDFTQGGRCEHI